MMTTSCGMVLIFQIRMGCFAKILSYDTKTSRYSKAQFSFPPSYLLIDLDNRCAEGKATFKIICQMKLRVSLAVLLTPKFLKCYNVLHF